LRHVHMTDADQFGSHLVWGEGIIPLDDYVGALKHAGYDGSLTIELTNARYNIEPTEPLARSVRVLTEALQR